jgi:glyoxylase-like metal-dependent hydrolase (beta-lactamase superfamily II)
MDELRPGLWTWTGEHPEWTAEMTWGPEVRSYAVQVDDRRVLIDPVQPAPPADAVLLTVPWHRRSTDELGLPVLDEPPPGIEARPGFFAEESAFWLPAHRAIVLGDAWMDDHTGPFEWASADADATKRLEALLELPFELVLPTHGDVTDRAAFEASLEIDEPRP